MTRVVLSLCILLVPLAAIAGPRPGLEAGGSWVWLSEEFESDDIHPGGRPDFNVAATLTFEGNGAWSLVSGLRYSRLGSQVDLDRIRTAGDPAGENVSATSTLTHQYLGVPAFARWRMRGNAAPFLFFGTEIAYLLEGTNRVEYQNGSEAGFPDEVETDVTDSVERLNVTFVLGAGVDVRTGGHAVDVALRYAHGVIDAIDSESLDWKTREVAATVGFRW